MTFISASVQFSLCSLDLCCCLAIKHVIIPTRSVAWKLTGVHCSATALVTDVCALCCCCCFNQLHRKKRQTVYQTLSFLCTRRQTHSVSGSQQPTTFFDRYVKQLLCSLFCREVRYEVRAAFLLSCKGFMSCSRYFYHNYSRGTVHVLPLKLNKKRQS